MPDTHGTTIRPVTTLPVSAKSLLRRCAAALLVLAGASPLACSFPHFEDEPAAPATTTSRGRGHGRRRGDPKDTPRSTATAPAPTSAPRPAATPDAPTSIHLAMGTPLPAGPSDDYLLVKPLYVVGYSHARNVPNWVSWNLNASYFGSAPRHKGKFLPDESLPADWYHAQDHDYSGSGYDRGHMVRSEERTRSPADNLTTFHITNVLPQTHDMNAGPWLRLEEYLQELAERGNKELYVTAGGLFSAKPKTIGHGLAVPEACFKIVVVLDRGQGLSDVTASTRVIAVIMPNEKGILDDPWGKYRAAVSEIEKRSRHTFLTAVPETIRKVLVAGVDTGPTGAH